jgi:hypothetical protein
MVFQIVLGFAGALSVLGAVAGLLMPSGLRIRVLLGFALQAGLLIGAALSQEVRTEGLLVIAAAGFFVQAFVSLRKAEQLDAPGLPVAPSLPGSVAAGYAPSLAKGSPTPTVPQELINARSGLDVSPRGWIHGYHTIPLLPPFSLLVGLPGGSRRPGTTWRDRWHELQELRIQSPVVRMPPQFTLAPGYYVMSPRREVIEQAPDMGAENIREMNADWRKRAGIRTTWYVAGDSEFIAWFDDIGRDAFGLVLIEDAKPQAIGKEVWRVLIPAGLRGGTYAMLGVVALATIIPSAVQGVAVSLRGWTFDHFDTFMFGLGLLLSLTAVLRRQFVRFIGFAFLTALVLAVTWLTGPGLDFLGL